jgi:hypothetical protein
MNEIKRNPKTDSTASKGLRLEIKRVRVRTTVKAGNAWTTDQDCDFRNQTSCRCDEGVASD